MKFSLVCPTRKRAIQREKLLQSLIDTTNVYGDVEILFAIDYDDNQSKENIEELIQKYSNLNIKLFRRNRSNFINRDYYNWLAGFAQGEFVWIVGDDITFIKKGWDGYIYNRATEYFKRYPDRIVCISAKDNTPVPSKHMPKFPCFPIFSQEAIRAMGFALHPQVPTWGADYIVYQLYKGVDRLLEIHEDTFLNHYSYHTRQTTEDEVAKHVGEIYHKLKMIPAYNTDRIIKEDLPHQIEYLKNVINGRIKL